MATLYANRIIREAGTEGAFTIDNVPDLWKQGTLDKLSEKGYDGYGNRLVTE